MNLIHKLNAALLARQPGTEPDNRHQQLGGMAPPSFAPWIRTLSDTLTESRLLRFSQRCGLFEQSQSLGLIEQMIQQTRPWVRFYVSATQKYFFFLQCTAGGKSGANITQTALRFDRQDVQQYFYRFATSLCPEPLQQLVSFNQRVGRPHFPSRLIHSARDGRRRYLAELSTMNSALIDTSLNVSLKSRRRPCKKTAASAPALLDRFSPELSQLICDTPADHPQFADYVRNHTFITP